MAEEISKKRIEKLGRALRAGKLTPQSEDWNLFSQYLSSQNELLGKIEKNLRHLVGPEVVIVPRLKTTTTLREKLIRTPSIQLPTMHDLIGIRVVGDFDLSSQDKLVASIALSFGDSVRKIIDRRQDPRSGYRAVHVILNVDGSFTEVQVRTNLQSKWADLYERLADEWGRQIRYGAGPSPDSQGVLVHREKLVKNLQKLSLSGIAEYEKSTDNLQFRDLQELRGSKSARGLSRPDLVRQMNLRSAAIQLADLQGQLEAKKGDWLAALLQDLKNLAREAEEIL
jgi:ppGpp synthetase/RelA/SpoT-type nucleotidyltranferase